MCGYGQQWQQLSLECRQRDNFTCRSCGAQPQTRADRRNWHADHIVPRERGGRDMLANLQTLCHDCHRRKTVSGKTARKQRQMDRLFRAASRAPRVTTKPRGRGFKTKALAPYQPRW